MKGVSLQKVLDINKYSDVPIYEQMTAQVERMVLLGLMEPRELLPSVRAVSQELGVNPNTVQKAYAELERRGVCFSVPGTGRFIAPTAPELLRARTEPAFASLREAGQKLALMGVSFEQASGELRLAMGENKEETGGMRQ